MSKELNVQTQIIHSIRKDGGYSRKLTNRFTIGIPDLVIGLYPFGLCLAEVKDMGEVVDLFDRDIGITPKQKLELKTANHPYGWNQTVYTPDRNVGFILVAIKHYGEHRLVALPPVAERLSHEYQAEPLRWTKRGVGGYYNLKPLMEWAGICKVGKM